MTIPIEFVAEGRPASVNAGKAKKDIWQNEVHWKATLQLHLNYFAAKKIPPPYKGDAVVHMIYFPMNRQYTDVDNGLKRTIDAFCPPLLKNDKTVQRIITERVLPSAGNKSIVSIKNAASLLEAATLALGTPSQAPIYASAIKVEIFSGNTAALW